MNLLLDTQVAIWSLAADRRLKATARRAIEDGSNRVWVSAASAWKIEIKTALEKLQVPADLLVHQVRDWYSGAAAYFGWMREAKRENTRCGL